MALWQYTLALSWHGSFLGACSTHVPFHASTHWTNRGRAVWVGHAVHIGLFMAVHIGLFMAVYIGSFMVGQVCLGDAGGRAVHEFSAVGARLGSPMDLEYNPGSCPSGCASIIRALCDRTHSTGFACPHTHTCNRHTLRLQHATCMPSHLNMQPPCPHILRCNLHASLFG